MLNALDVSYQCPKFIISHHNPAADYPWFLLYMQFHVQEANLWGSIQLRIHPPPQKKKNKLSLHLDHTLITKT